MIVVVVDLFLFWKGREGGARWLTSVLNLISLLSSTALWDYWGITSHISENGKKKKDLFHLMLNFGLIYWISELCRVESLHCLFS